MGIVKFITAIKTSSVMPYFANKQCNYDLNTNNRKIIFWIMIGRKQIIKLTD